MISLQKVCFLALVVFIAAGVAASQPNPSGPDDGIPVLIKHLPDWETARAKATFATSVGELKTALGERSVLDRIDFAGGTEAVTAPYDAGKLLIVEYIAPQDSIEADAVFKKAVSGDTSIVYRRIGNYNAFVFDTTDTTTANALLDQVKYEKDVQWLGDNPYIISAERSFVLTITDIFLSTFLVIVLGIVAAIAVGGVTGYLYFRHTDRRRSHLATFSDAGGMIRLNLDGFTPEVSAERLLKDRS